MPRLRWRLQTTMVAVAILAIAIGGWVQVDHWKRVELAQRKAMMRALPELRVRRFFGPRGVGIVKEAAEVEIVRVAPRDEGWTFPWGDPVLCPVTPTGKLLDTELVARLSDALLDGSNYFHVSDLPYRPRLALRFRRGGETLDVVLSHASGNHFDLWAFQADAQGKLVHGRGQGWYCLDDPKFAALIREIAGADFDDWFETPR
jgi:hypothetical protein